MTNRAGPRRGVTIVQWLESQEMCLGVLSIYADVPFDYEKGINYEFGRQIGSVLKLKGYKRGEVVRKQPSKSTYAFVKTKLPVLALIIKEELGYTPKSLAKTRG